MPSLEALFARFGLALVLGFLIGLERERDKPLIFAGMRTFALISLLGAVLAFVSENFAGYWLLIVGFGAVAAFALVSHIKGFETGHVGITTEVAFLLAFLLGSLVYWELLTLSAAVTVVVVLPILPNRTYGPFDVLNPREIWLMVVFIAGINLAGYILPQFIGAGRSIGLTGVLGGMISSTAVTFELARRSRSERERDFATLFALAIALASTGMFFRALILAAVLNPSLAIGLVLPMLTGAIVAALGVALMWRQARQSGDSELERLESRERRSPFALRPALQFGLIFAVVLWVSKAAMVLLGDIGVYVSSAVGGLAGMDAIALSMAKLAGYSITQAVAIRAVTLGAAANMVFKGAIAAILGGGNVRREILPLFLLAAVTSTTTAFLTT